MKNLPTVGIFDSTENGCASAILSQLYHFGDYRDLIQLKASKCSDGTLANLQIFFEELDVANGIPATEQSEGISNPALRVALPSIRAFIFGDESHCDSSSLMKEFRFIMKCPPKRPMSPAFLFQRIHTIFRRLHGSDFEALVCLPPDRSSFHCIQQARPVVTADNELATYLLVSVVDCSIQKYVDSWLQRKQTRLSRYSYEPSEVPMCGSCQKNADGKFFLHFPKELPKLLTFSINIFRSERNSSAGDIETIKVNHQVKIDPWLQIPLRTDVTDSEACKLSREGGGLAQLYEMIGVIVHEGDVRSGEYVSYVNVRGPKWQSSSSWIQYKKSGPPKSVSLQDIMTQRNRVSEKACPVMVHYERREIHKPGGATF